MTAYDYITFDPIGYLPFNRYSSIVSFKNVLLYKFLKDLEPDDYGNDQAHQENANQKIAKCFNEFTKFLRKLTLESFAHDLWEDETLRVTTELKIIQIDGLDISQCEDVFDLIREYQEYWYKNLTPFISVPDELDEQLNREYNYFLDSIRDFTPYNGFKFNYSGLRLINPAAGLDATKEEIKLAVDIASSIYKNLQIIAKTTSKWMRKMWSVIFREWYKQFTVLFDMETAEYYKIDKYIRTLTVTEMPSLSDFADHLFSFVEDPVRKKYFQNQKYNIKKMTARIGGRSIIEWFGHIFFNQDTEFYAIDKSQWLINEYLKFADLSGFDIKDTNFVKFITILIKQYVPLDQYIENEKFAYFQKIEKDYKDLKETFDYLWKELPEVHRHYIYKLVDFLGKENLTNEFLQSLKNYRENYKNSFGKEAIDAFEVVYEKAIANCASIAISGKQKEERAYLILEEIGKKFDIPNMKDIINQEIDKGSEYAINRVGQIIEEHIFPLIQSNQEYINNILQEGKNKDQTINEKDQSINEKDQKINDKKEKIKNLKQEIEKAKQAAQEYFVNHEQVQKSEELRENLQKEVNRLKEIVKEKEQQAKELTDKFNQKMKEFEKTKLESDKQIEDKVNELKEKEKKLEIKDEVLKNNVEKRLQDIILHKIPHDIGPDGIERFRALFLEQIGINYPDLKDYVINLKGITNDMEFGNKKVNEWFELYLKIANSKNSRDDFNPEGIYANSPARVTEQEKVRTFLHDQIKRNTFLDFTDFKFSIIACAEQQQQEYFMEYFNHKKIRTAIFGNKTLEEWYKVFSSNFFVIEEDD